MLRALSCLLASPVKISILSFNIVRPYSIVGNLFKKQREQSESSSYQKQQSFKSENNQQNNQQQDPEYDFKRRKLDVQLEKDFRKLRQLHNTPIPQGVGQGGFEQAVYWSQFARNPEVVNKMVEVFNRIPSNSYVPAIKVPFIGSQKISIDQNQNLIKIQNQPKEIQMTQTYFKQFIGVAEASIYLCSDFRQLTAYALFGFKYNVQSPDFWFRLQQKVVRSAVNDMQSLITIVFAMSRSSHGSEIYNHVEKHLQNNTTLTLEQAVQLLIAFQQMNRGQKKWIKHLLQMIQIRLSQAKTVEDDILTALLPILKKVKQVPQKLRDTLLNTLKLQSNHLGINCIGQIGMYYNKSDEHGQLWVLLEDRLVAILSGKAKDNTQNRSKEGLVSLHNTIAKNKTTKMLNLTPANLRALILGVLNSYNFSPQMIQKYLIPIFSTPNILMLLSISQLSSLSKGLYIYQLQTKIPGLEQQIQHLLIAQLPQIKLYSEPDLIAVAKDYSVTRLGSTKLYHEIQRAIMNKMEDLTKSHQSIQALKVIYDHSNLCSVQLRAFLQSIL